MVSPMKGVMLLRSGPCRGVLSRIAAARLVIAAPVASPCTARAATSAPAECAVRKAIWASTFIASAPRITGRRPT